MQGGRGAGATQCEGGKCQRARLAYARRPADPRALPHAAIGARVRGCRGALVWVFMGSKALLCLGMQALVFLRTKARVLTEVQAWAILGTAGQAVPRA